MSAATYAATALAVLDRTIVTLNQRRREFVAVRVFEAMGEANVDRFQFGVVPDGSDSFRISGDVPDGILNILTGLQYLDFPALDFAEYEDYDDDDDATIYVVDYADVHQSVLRAFPKYPSL